MRATSYLKKQMESDPALALRAWQAITNDYTFKPMSFDEQQHKTEQANALLESQKTYLPENTYNKLSQLANTSPQMVIQHCEKSVEAQIHKQREKDISTFNHLSKEYTQLSSSYAERESKHGQGIAKQLKEMSAHYAKDEGFNRAIENNSTSHAVQKSLVDDQERIRGFER
jgi:guanylate kinase